MKLIDVLVVPLDCLALLLEKRANRRRVLRNQRKEASIFIGNRAWIGDTVFVREGVTIGDDAIIGANSVVTKNIPANALAGGVPARVIRYREESQDEAK